MKVIDKKVKLLGKLNIVDLLVFVLIIAVIAILGVRLLGNNEDFTASSAKLTYTVRVTAQVEELVESVAEYADSAAGKSDQLMANVGNIVTNEVGTQEVRIGKTHIVKTTHSEFLNGVIESCTWETAE